MDAGLLVLRALLAAVLFAHATQKLWGWFGGPGRAKSSEMFAALGHRPAALMELPMIVREVRGSRSSAES